VVYFLQLSPLKFCIHFSSPHTCHIPHPSHATRCNCSGDIWLTVKFTKFLTMQFSPASCHFLPLSRKYLPQHPVLSRTPSACVLPLMSETRFHIHTKSCDVHLLVFFSLTVRRQGTNPGNEFTPISGAIKTGHPSEF
jgi:hypothetical protein